MQPGPFDHIEVNMGDRTKEWACEGCEPERIVVPPACSLYAQDDEDDARHGSGGYLVICPYSEIVGQAQFCTRFLAQGDDDV